MSAQVAQLLSLTTFWLSTEAIVVALHAGISVFSLRNFRQWLMNVIYSAATAFFFQIDSRTWIFRKFQNSKFGAANKVVKWTTTTRSMSVRHLANLSRRISCFVTSGSFITIFIRPRGKWAKHWAVSGARWAECEAVDALRIFGLQIFGWDGVSADLSPCHLSKTSTGQHSSFHFLHWSVDSVKLTEIFRSLADN